MTDLQEAVCVCPWLRMPLDALCAVGDGRGVKLRARLTVATETRAGLLGLLSLMLFLVALASLPWVWRISHKLERREEQRRGDAMREKESDRLHYSPTEPPSSSVKYPHLRISV